MAKAVRPRRIVIAASVLSLALAAPLVTVPDAPFLPVAGAVEASVFNQRYTTENFWNSQEAVVKGLTLEAGDTVAATTNTIFNWKFRNDNGTLILIRPQSGTAFRTGNVDIAVRVTPASGAPFTTTLRVNVVDQDTRPAPQESGKFANRYTTANFWNEREVQIPNLKLEPGTRIETAGNTIFDWPVRSSDGDVYVSRPQSSTAYGTGNRDIKVRVTEANGSKPYETTLRLNVIDSRTPKDWEKQLDARKKFDAQETNNPQAISGVTIPAGVTIEKGGITPPPGWVVTAQNGELVVTPPESFIPGNIDLPLKVNDGTDTFDLTLRLDAQNPSKDPKDIAGTVGGILGPILGGLIGGGGGNGKSALEGIVKVEVQPSAVVVGPSAVVVTGNANPTVEIKDNLSNNKVDAKVEPSAVLIKDNASNNASNNTVEAKVEPSAVVVKDNASNNSAVVSGNGVVQPSAVVVTGNANPSNNGSNNTVSGNGVVEPGAVSIKDNGIVQPGAVVAEGSLFGRRGGAGAGTGAGSSSQGVGGLSDPRCVASLVGLGIPLAAMIPVALAQTLNLPALDASAAIAAGAFDQILGQLGVAPSQVAAVGGGIVGVALAATIAAVAITCTPKESSAEVVVGAAPVVPTA